MGKINGDVAGAIIVSTVMGIFAAYEITGTDMSLPNGIFIGVAMIVGVAKLLFE
jgi:hypothetical protein